ncbi:hypothetical protein [Macrococcus bovicus]|uniref:hypothetical protein n=1 Tax=Macrococcus bovicus TaxID=69968 RepID=UPI0025A60084|nr:hypothetical protein [Macrococcus bovicus]WJP98439.1 hypothetical protein QSV55_03810 [Macrococcus bovicus]
MKTQVVIKKSVIGWFNLYKKGKLIANLPPETMKELLPGFTGSYLACCEMDLSLINKLTEVE